jgi:hypothetical protein
MSRRRSPALAFGITLVAAGSFVCAQASTPDDTPVAVHGKTAVASPWTHVAASGKNNPMPRSHPEKRTSGMTTAEMIYLHESLVSNLVSVTPVAVPAPPSARCRLETSSAARDCS